MARSLRVEVVGDASQYQRTLRGAAKQTEGFTGFLGKMGSAAGLGYAGLAVAAVGVAKFGAEAVKQASQVQKFEEAVKANFGSASESVLEFANTAPKLGLVDDAALETAASFGILFKNLGIGHERAAEMTVGWEKLGTAIAAIKGQDPADVIKRLTLAAAGNTRGLKQMGIVLDSTTIKREALREGILKEGQAITPAIKAQAIYALATKHLGEFQQQAAAHSGDLVNKQRVLTAEWDQAKEQLGTALLPAVTQLVTVLANNLPEAIRVTTAIMKGLKPLLDSTKASFLIMMAPMRAIIALIHGDWAGAWEAFRQPLEAGAKFYTEVFGGIASTISGFVTSAATAAAQFGAGIYNGMVSGITGFADWITGRVTAGIAAITGALGTALTTATTFGANILNGMKAGILGFVDWITSRVTDGIKAITDALGKALTEGTAFGSNILSGMKSGITGFVGHISNLISSAISFITDHVKAAGAAALRFGSSIFDGVKDGVKDLVSLIVDPLKSAVSWIVGAAKGAGSAAEALGSAIYNGIKAGLGPIISFVEGVISAVQRLLDLLHKLGGGGSGAGTPFQDAQNIGKGKAAGGFVQRGMSYMVGERGPEMFVPGTSGTIIPNGARGTTVNVYVQGALLGSSVDEVAATIRKALGRYGTINALAG